MKDEVGGQNVQEEEEEEEDTGEDEVIRAGHVELMREG